MLNADNLLAVCCFSKPVVFKTVDSSLAGSERFIYRNYTSRFGELSFRRNTPTRGPKEVHNQLMSVILLNLN